MSEEEIEPKPGEAWIRTYKGGLASELTWVQPNVPFLIRYTGPAYLTVVYVDPHGELKESHPSRTWNWSQFFERVWPK